MLGSSGRARSQATVIPEIIISLGKYGMAAVTTGLLVQSSRFVGCSCGLLWVMPGLGLPLCTV